MSEPIREFEAAFPLQMEREGDTVRLAILDRGPYWVRLLSYEENYPDGDGNLRTAFEWRKQDVDAGGRFTDSVDGVHGFAATGSGSGPRTWPAFIREHCEGSGSGSGGSFLDIFPPESLIGCVVQLYPGEFDSNADPLENHDQEWFFSLNTGGGSGSIIEFVEPLAGGPAPPHEVLEYGQTVIPDVATMTVLDGVPAWLWDLNRSP